MNINLDTIGYFLYMEEQEGSKTRSTPRTKEEEDEPIEEEQED